MYYLQNECHFIALQAQCTVGPDGGTGRRVGLKNQWPQGRAGSIPAPGTFFILHMFDFQAS